MSLPKVNTGRNLPVATAVGLTLFGAVILSLAFNRLIFAIFVAVFSVFAARELIKLFATKDIRVTTFLLPVTPFVVLLTYVQGLGYGLIALVVLNFVAWLWQLRRGTAGFLGSITGFSFSLLYVGGGLAFAAELARQESGFGLVMTSILLTAANDTGGYFAGIFAGRHPIFPEISPKKSWEGFAGSVALALVIGVFVVPGLIEVSPLSGAIAAVIMCFTATAGDMIESGIKRDTGVKDTGNSIPGHGGFLDRIDSQLINSWVAYLIFVTVLHV